MWNYVPGKLSLTFPWNFCAKDPGRLSLPAHPGMIFTDLLKQRDLTG